MRVRYIGSGLALLTLAMLAFAGQIDNSATRPYVDAKVAAGVAEAVGAIPTSRVAYATSAGTAATATNALQLGDVAASGYVTNGGATINGQAISNGAAITIMGGASTNYCRVSSSSDQNDLSAGVYTVVNVGDSVASGELSRNGNAVTGLVAGASYLVSWSTSYHDNTAGNAVYAIVWFASGGGRRHHDGTTGSKEGTGFLSYSCIVQPTNNTASLVVMVYPAASGVDLDAYMSALTVTKLDK